MTDVMTGGAPLERVWPDGCHGDAREAGVVRRSAAQFVNGILAQLVEHLTFNQVVGGSNPPCLMS